MIYRDLSNFFDQAVHPAGLSPHIQEPSYPPFPLSFGCSYILPNETTYLVCPKRGGVNVREFR